MIKLSENQKEELRHVVLEGACLLESEKDDIISSIQTWLERQPFEHKSYSTIIIENGEVAKRCDLGYLHTYPKKDFRKNNIKALCTLVAYWEENGVGMTTPQLSALCSPLKGEHLLSSVAHFPELRFWGLIVGTTGKRMNEIYTPTISGAMFLKDEMSIDSHVYTKKDEITGEVVLLAKEEWPDECEKPVQRFCSEIDYVDHNDPATHVENAVSNQ